MVYGFLLSNRNGLWGPNWFLKWSRIIEHVTFIIYAISLEIFCISVTYLRLF